MTAPILKCSAWLLQLSFMWALTINILTWGFLSKIKNQAITTGTALIAGFKLLEARWQFCVSCQLRRANSRQLFQECCQPLELSVSNKTHTPVHPHLHARMRAHTLSHPPTPTHPPSPPHLGVNIGYGCNRFFQYGIEDGHHPIEGKGLRTQQLVVGLWRGGGRGRGGEGKSVISCAKIMI